MKHPTRPLALALSLAFSAMSAGAYAAAPEAAPADPLASASREVQQVARWVLDSGDNGRLPFVLVDKVHAQVYVFGPAGQFRGTAPALLGMAKGDRLLVANGEVMENMSPQQRITPAGRFVSRLAIDSKGAELLVLDYDAAISLHPVITTKPEEHRPERLASATVEDNRISYGCINVPADFYSKVVSPGFARTRGVVYILPETRSASEQFGFKPDANDALAQAGASAHQLRAAAAH